MTMDEQLTKAMREKLHETVDALDALSVAIGTLADRQRELIAQKVQLEDLRHGLVGALSAMGLDIEVLV